MRQIMRDFSKKKRDINKLNQTTFHVFYDNEKEVEYTL